MCGIWGLFGYESNDVKLFKSVMTINRRGPDNFIFQNMSRLQNCMLGFHRIQINDHNGGMQPMRLVQHPHLTLICNGEIYNFDKLRKAYNFDMESSCDCEIILHLYEKFGAEGMCKELDGVFALLIFDTKNMKITLARDTYGVRPLFTFQTEDNKLGVCSEAKGLIDILRSKDEGTDKSELIKAFPPAHFSVYSFQKDGTVSLDSHAKFHDFTKTPEHFKQTTVKLQSTAEDTSRPAVLANIRALFTDAVEKRLMSGRPVGSLLSGGLDSSLVAAITAVGQKKKGITEPIQTFSIGLGESPDVIAARKVAEHIGSEHYEVSFTPEEGFEAVRETIYALESFDVTTVRASTPMYLLAKYISEKTETIVIMSGEGADELAQGYIYFHKQPSLEEGDKESKRLLKDLYMYDVLRTDRSTAAHGLEVRAPFLDHSFTSYYLSLPAEMRRPTNGVEKHLLRSAFSDANLIPSEILWRPKEAFSDGVSSKKKSWFEILQGYIDEQVSDEDMQRAPETFPFRPPATKEAYYYRQVFESNYGSKMAKLIPYQWMPKWIGECNDPSARVLSHYKNDEDTQVIEVNGQVNGQVNDQVKSGVQLAKVNGVVA